MFTSTERYPLAQTMLSSRHYFCLLVEALPLQKILTGRQAGGVAIQSKRRSLEVSTAALTGLTPGIPVGMQRHVEFRPICADTLVRRKLRSLFRSCMTW